MIKRVGWVIALGGALVGLSSAPAASTPISASLGGGIYVPLDRELREVYGTGGAFSVALLTPLKENRSRLRVEIGYASAAGRHLPEDPTFELAENRYWLLPLSLGVEANANPSAGRDGVAIYVGLHGIIAFTGWDDPLLGDFGAPTLGAALELRPEFPIQRAVSLWVSYRMVALSRVDYRRGARSASEFGYTGGLMQAGLSYDWH